jgi:hypothetical protein
MSKKRTLGYQQLACKECGDVVSKVDIDADAITCSRCVQRQLAGPGWISEEVYFDQWIDLSAPGIEEE